MLCLRPNKYSGWSIWHVNQCSPQPGSAKAGYASGNVKGIFCFSKDLSTAVTHSRAKKPSCTRQYTSFKYFFCTVNSWWFLFTVIRLLQLIYFGSVFAPSLTLVDSLSGAQFCLQGFGVRRNLIPNHPGNGASSQTIILLMCTLPPWKASTLSFSRFGHLWALSCPVFRACTRSLFDGTCKAHLNLILLNFSPVSKTQTKVWLNFLLPFHPGLQVKATPSLCLHMNFSWQ